MAAPQNENQNQNNLVLYMAEFDKACNIVGGGVELPIEDQATKEACMILCMMANSAKMAYATIRNNQDYRTAQAAQEDVGPQAFQGRLEDG